MILSRKVYWGCGFAAVFVALAAYVYFAASDRSVCWQLGGMPSCVSLVGQSNG